MPAYADGVPGLQRVLLCFGRRHEHMGMVSDELHRI